MENNNPIDQSIGRSIYKLMRDLRSDPELWQKVLKRAEQLSEAEDG